MVLRDDLGQRGIGPRGVSQCLERVGFVRVRLGTAARHRDRDGA